MTTRGISNEIAFSAFLAIGIAIAFFGWWRAYNDRIALEEAMSATQVCKELACKLENLRESGLSPVEIPIKQDRLLGIIVDHLKKCEIAETSMLHATPVAAEPINNSPFIRNGIEIELRDVSQKELLAFLRACFAEDLPLLATRIRLDAVDEIANKDGQEKWNAKLLLTYLVRSTKSS